jgi:C4-dicarboxylate-specific signal transduction histidine kinase
MGEFAASIAHEVNQPLAAVVANADACRRWLGRSVPDLEEAKAALERISRDGKRASDVIAGMRSLLQRAPTVFAMLDLGGVVRDVLELVGPEVARQRVVLQRSLATDLPAVRGDRVQLQQVVLNLTTNAIQAMSAVTDRTRELHIAVSHSDIDGAPAVVVAVRDNGVGFAPDVGARLFAAFYTTKRDGLGMGLAISRSIVEAHGGRLWAAPNPDHGATFQFAVPLGG